MPVEILDYRQKDLIINSFSLKDTDILCKSSSVIFDGQLSNSILGMLLLQGLQDDYIFGITDYVLSFEGIYFLYENLENVNYNHNFNAHEVIRTSNFSLCQPS